MCTRETVDLLTLEIAMQYVCCWLCVSLAPALWVEAATLRSAPMVGVWAATGTPLRATVELQDAQDRVQPIKYR